MGRVGGIGRSRAGRAGFVAGAIAALVLGLAAPGMACNAIVGGSIDCSTGQRVVHWSIANDQVTLTMTIVHALSSVGSNYLPTTGWASAVGPAGSTSATTIIPDGTTGTITLNVYATWPGYANVSGGSVNLGGNCPPPTTTTTTTTTTAPPPTTTTTYPTNTTVPTSTTYRSYPTSTTNPETTTIPWPYPTTTLATTTSSAPIGAGPTTTTTLDVPTSSTEVAGTTIYLTTTTRAGATTTVAEQGGSAPTTTKGKTTPLSFAGSLPRTGSGTWLPISFGLSFVVSGVLLVRRRRRSAITHA